MVTNGTSKIPRKSDGTFKKGFISPLRNGELRTCEVCKTLFYLQGYRVNDLSRGKTCSRECKGKSTIGLRVSQETEFKKGENLAEKHKFWKGDKVGYMALHKWIHNNWGKAGQCFRCRVLNKKYQWANVTGVYDRNKKNWEQLCLSCHRKEDIKNPKRPNYGKK
jgi:hypothetical protein